MAMVEVFKTNVQENKQAVDLIDQLCFYFPDYKASFDLDDCDKILRVEGSEVEIEKIISTMANHGFECVVLM